MIFRWIPLMCAALVGLTVLAHAQTTDYHLRFGMKPSKSTPPEVIDMKWARQYMDDNATLPTNATTKEN